MNPSATRILGVIPARLASKRFPNKPLADIAGKSMIQRVYERTRLCSQFDEVLVATDSSEIAQVVEGFGGRALATRPDHRTGLDRIIETAELKPDFDLYINVQGDEPLIPVQTIAGVIENFFRHPEAEISTAASFFTTLSDAKDPNQVKVVLDATNKALYFSRSLVPHLRNQELPPNTALKHQGIYGYTKSALRKIKALPPSPLEDHERLEQLRFLHYGMAIFVHVTEFDSVGVDTPQDLEKVVKLITKENAKN